MTRAARGTPEVVVKITGAAKVHRGIRGALAYIGRDGEVAMTTDQGTVHRGPNAAEAGTRYLLADAPLPPGTGRKGRPARRETLNLALSMPAGVDPDGFRDGATAFAAAAFPDNAWVLARHDDTKHVHAHLVVRVAGRDGTRLNPRKADLREWREGFAESLRMHGIGANATSRYLRGSPARGQSQSLHHIERRALETVVGGMSPEPSAFTDRLHRGPDTPEQKAAARAATDAARQAARAAYRDRAIALKASASTTDRQIGSSLDAFVNTWPRQPKRRGDATRERFAAAEVARDGVPEGVAHGSRELAADGPARSAGSMPPGPADISRDDGPDR